MTRTTAAQMTATPLKTAKVAGSSKTRMPTVTAVSGSPTPRMEARVEPMRWMARIRVRLEMTAVMMASSRLRASCSQVLMISKVPEIRALTRDTPVPKNSTQKVMLRPEMLWMRATCRPEM